MQAQPAATTPPSSAKHVHIDLGDRSYPILIAPALLDDPATFASLPAGNAALVVTNTTGRAATLCSMVDWNGDGDFQDFVGGSIESAAQIAVPTGSNDLVVDESTVSRFHCELWTDDLGVRVRDLDSKNGTFVDGMRIIAVVVSRNVEVRLGGTTFNKSKKTVEKAVKQLAEELTHQYKVTYARPQTLIPPDRVTVSAAKPGLTIRGIAQIASTDYGRR